MNRTIFYDTVRTGFARKLFQGQIEGMESILNRWEISGLSDDRWLAYMLATAWHETATTMQPVEEIGRGMGRRYGKKVKFSGELYTTPDKIYYGRGLVQITWYENYELMSKVTGVDLLNHPERALEMDIATHIMFHGMRNGSFTGRRLSRYFNSVGANWEGARAIINGEDRAELIAGYGRLFHKAIIKAK
jgi:hypothetical protein